MRDQDKKEWEGSTTFDQWVIRICLDSKRAGKQTPELRIAIQYFGKERIMGIWDEYKRRTEKTN